MAHTRGPLGAGIVTLIVVDVVLVLVFVAVLLQAVRADVVDIPGFGVATTTPRAAAEGPAGATPTTDPAGDVTFAMPSGNIRCTLAADATTCLIVQIGYEEPVLEGCEGTVGHEVRLTPDGAAWVCSTGGTPGAAGPEVPVLDYGERTTAHGYTCASDRSGVTCVHDASGHSFTLARAGATFG